MNPITILTALRVLFLMSILVLPVLPQAPPGVVLRGSVTDPYGAVIPEAIILLTSETKSYRVITSSAGDYSIGLAPGIYKVVADASKNGFPLAYRSDIEIAPNTSRSLNFQLHPRVFILARSYGKRSADVRDHPAGTVADFSYEDIPGLSETGVRNGKVRFSSKCFTPSVQTIVYGSGRHLMDMDVNVTFTYDLLTVDADEIRFDSLENAVYAVGNVTIDDGKRQKYDSVIRITVKNGKPKYEMVDEL